MGFGDYLATLNLSPGAAQKLTQQYGPPAVPPAEEFAPPTAEEQARYGVSPEQAQRLANANAGAAATPGQSVAAPVLEPGWTPEKDTKRREEGKQRAALEAANPQGPTGSDGFPTYKDLSGAPGSSGGSGGAQVMPMQRIAAHWQPGTRSYSAQYGFNPDELKEGQYHRDAAAGQGMLAADKQLEAAQMQADADVAYAQRHERANEIAAARLARVQQERADYVLREREKMEEMAQAANAKVDVDLAQGPAGAQIMSAIMVGLGQFGASLTGGPNTAHQIVQAGIDRRIAAQQSNIRNAQDALKQRGNLYAQNLAEFGDKERAVLATKAAYLDQAKAATEQVYAKAKGTANEGAYHAMMQKFENDRAEVADQFSKLTHTQRVEQGNEHYVPTQYVGGGAGAGQKGKEGLYVPTLNGYARDAETAKKLNEQGAMRMQINEDLREMNSLLQESKGLNSVTDYGRMQEIKERVGALKNGVLQRTTVLAGQGAMSNGDRDVAEIRSALSTVDPQWKTDGAIERAQKGIKQVAVAHQRDHRIAGEAAGVQLGQEQYVAGPSGPTPVARLQGRNKTVSKETQSYDDLVEGPKGVSQRK